MIDNLLLLSGNDIPFAAAGLTIHQPILKQIAYIGEENFFISCQILNYSKKQLKNRDENILEKYSDFEVLMAMIRNSNDVSVMKIKNSLKLFFLLLFPDYKIDFLPVSIMFSKDSQRHLIDNNNFIQFKKNINEIFCYEYFTKQTQQKYNPGGPQARALVQKFKERQRKLQALKNKGEKENKSIFANYISILSIGTQKDMNNLFHYTVYQLLDEFHRFRLKQDYDFYVSAKLAGAKDLENVTNWMTNQEGI